MSLDLIKEYINKDPISFIHIIELLKNKYTIIYSSNNGFIIKDDLVDFVYVSFSDKDEMERVLSSIHLDSFIAYDKMIPDYYNKTSDTIKLFQYVYDSNIRFDVSDYDIRVLDEKYIDIIDKTYKAFGPLEDNGERIKSREVLGIFENNELAGFIGRHPEGCMGMLYVFEKYRKKGYGIVLEKAKINDLLDHNCKVFEEVVENNDISIHMQEKLGFKRGNRKIYWLI